MYKSIRLLIIAYSIAMASMIAFGVYLYLEQEKVTAGQDGYGEMINIAGQQRLLTQKIVFLIDQLANVPEVEASYEAEISLAETIQLLSQSHERLTRGDLRWRTTSPNHDGLSELYFENRRPLDRRITRFIRKAQKFQSDGLLPQNHQKDADRLIIQLNKTISLYEADDQFFTEQMRKITVRTTGVFALILAALSALVFLPLMRMMKKSEDELHATANTDYLTGCKNRRGFTDALISMSVTLKREQSPMTLIVLDIDHFKSVNDNYGHAVGDMALKHVANVVRNNIRSSDIFGRIGGEEFAIGCPKTSHRAGMDVAEKIRKAVESAPYLHNHKEIPLTVSLGVCSMVAPFSIKPNTMMEVADKALYLAKMTGRNKVCTAPSFSSEAESAAQETG